MSEEKEINVIGKRRLRMIKRGRARSQLYISVFGGVYSEGVIMVQANSRSDARELIRDALSARWETHHIPYGLERVTRDALEAMVFVPVKRGVIYLDEGSD